MLRIHGTSGEGRLQLEREGQTNPFRPSVFSAVVKMGSFGAVLSVGKRTAFFSFLVRGFPDLPTSGAGGGGAGTYCWEVVSADVDAKFSTLSTSASRVRVTLPFLAVSKVK